MEIGYKLRTSLVNLIHMPTFQVRREQFSSEDDSCKQSKEY